MKTSIDHPHPNTSVYFCPRCSNCYCDHKYLEEAFIWVCPDKTRLTLEQHQALHHLRDKEEKKSL